MKKHQKEKSVFKLLFLERSSGFSLAEVMVGAGILGALSLVVVNLTSNINRSQRSMENKFQISQIHQEINAALRDRGACSDTVAGAPRVPDVPAGGTPIISIFTGAVDPADANIPLITTGDVLGGDGNPLITITEIRLISYAARDGNVTTTDGAGVATTRDYGPATIRVTIDRGDTASAENADFQAKVALGRTRFERDFRIKILVDPGTNTVQECYAVEESVVEAACEALDGVFSQADGKCREIKIQEDPADANSNYAITSRGGVLVQEGGMRVGNFPLTSAQPGTGNLELELNADVGGNASVTGNLLVQGTGQIDQNVGIGIAPAVGGNPARLLVQSDANGTGFNVVNGANSVSMLNSGAGHIHLTKGTATDSIRVDSTNTTNNLITANISGALRFRVTHEGRVSIPVPAAASSDTNPVSAIDIGVNGGPYFAAFIRNQPASPTSLSDFDIRGTRGDEVATKRWAASVIYARLTTDTVNQIADNITAYANNNQLDAIKRMICISSRVQLTMGTGTGEELSQFATGSYSGGPNGVCTFSPSFCHLGDRCGVLHVTGINSTGEILASGAAASIRVQNGASSVVLGNTGTVVATNNISSSTLVTAPIVRGTGGGVNQGVCGAFGCATRFGRQLCAGGRIMIGIARGQVVCAGALAPYSP